MNASGPPAFVSIPLPKSNELLAEPANTTPFEGSLARPSSNSSSAPPYTCANRSAPGFPASGGGAGGPGGGAGASGPPSRGGKPAHEPSSSQDDGADPEQAPKATEAEKMGTNAHAART